MSFKKHSPPTTKTNQQINQSTNQLTSTTYPTNQPTNINQLTNQPTNINQLTNQPRPFFTGFFRLSKEPRNQGLGPEHAKIQQSDHLWNPPTREVSVGRCRWVTSAGYRFYPTIWGWENHQQNPSNVGWDRCIFQDYLLDLYFSLDVLCCFLWWHMHLDLFSLELRCDVFSLEPRCIFCCIWNWDVLELGCIWCIWLYMSLFGMVSFVCSLKMRLRICVEGEWWDVIFGLK